MVAHGSGIELTQCYGRGPASSMELGGKPRSLLDDLAGNDGVLVVRVDGAQPVIAVGDDESTVHRVANEQQGRERDSRRDLLIVLLDVGVADTEQRESRSAKDVLRLELGHRGATQPLHELLRELRLDIQRE